MASMLTMNAYSFRSNTTGRRVLSTETQLKGHYDRRQPCLSGQKVNVASDFQLTVDAVRSRCLTKVLIESRSIPRPVSGTESPSRFDSAPVSGRRKNKCAPMAGRDLMDAHGLL